MTTDAAWGHFLGGTTARRCIMQIWFEMNWAEKNYGPLGSSNMDLGVQKESAQCQPRSFPALLPVVVKMRTSIHRELLLFNPCRLHHLTSSRRQKR